MIRTIRSGVKNLIPRSLLIRTLSTPADNRLLLTFDDGPDPEVTPGVLERLQAFNARGVFFVVGRLAEAGPELLTRIRDEGHILGNHTYTHENAGDPPFLAYKRDVARCQDVVHKATGLTPTLFRPPKGHLSATSLLVPKLLGLRTVNWTLGVRDWACRTGEEAAAAAATLEERAAPGQIIVLHDDNRFLLQILDQVLPVFRERGYDLASAAAGL
ncbi:MAG: polysaccharide deacetylase family protein [Acidobacteria bacterium]|uniref:Polysaccharide deacetylase family protein n=1 Tax=Candidatus Polarisedimenticola svalbardensis TaxID=2886004 RepID=A0A8J6XW02_9BACT|nr:polysaccharide deacetylase family protein [Candidatus Polarisedimenticola svalbardensis]